MEDSYTDSKCPQCGVRYSVRYRIMTHTYICTRCGKSWDKDYELPSPFKIKTCPVCNSQILVADQIVKNYFCSDACYHEYMKMPSDIPSVVNMENIIKKAAADAPVSHIKSKYVNPRGKYAGRTRSSIIGRKICVKCNDEFGITVADATIAEKTIYCPKCLKDINFSAKRTCCRTLQDHHEALKEDPERLTTDFIKKLSRCECDDDAR
jgi:DNA-directed RNA polymerase subunit RPC12/RpoP